MVPAINIEVEGDVPAVPFGSAQNRLDYALLRVAVYRALLGRQGHTVNRKRVQRLMRTMGLRAIYRRPRTSKSGPGHKIYPYLLSGMEITRPNQVWAADITYIPMAKGFLYLVLPGKDGLV